MSDPDEAAEILNTFVKMLAQVTADGQRKRRKGKPFWQNDPDHEAAAERHRQRRLAGEERDPDSGARPDVHEAWRLLALAWQKDHREM